MFPMGANFYQSDGIHQFTIHIKNASLDDRLQ